MDIDLKKLNEFLGKAALATYAGGGPEMDPETLGFKELEYREGDWYYRDSYCGFFQSWGREVVWHKDKPIWVSLYGGGIEGRTRTDTQFEHQTFGFLKKALSAGEKQKAFQPRGPKNFKDGEWNYVCDWNGDISKFSGHEEISHGGERVFTHDFIGGLAEGREY